MSGYDFDAKGCNIQSSRDLFRKNSGAEKDHKESDRRARDKKQRSRSRDDPKKDKNNVRISSSSSSSSSSSTSSSERRKRKKKKDKQKKKAQASAEERRMAMENAARSLVGTARRQGADFITGGSEGFRQPFANESSPMHSGSSLTCLEFKRGQCNRENCGCQHK
eukprot:TRINITY_DN1737_c0_g1_i1.p1 TRINITY_DN1737_c0_g1~~TRINITY_DN1737_c0_g1_i1.p1  ORF type:complete len:165 (+),score=41.01 TRINITY_DN1737_c0_g1_i1:50-544(+)